MKTHPLPLFFARACARLTFCAVLAIATPATAQEPATSDHGKRARIAYDLRDWQTAVMEYRIAYETEPKSEYLFGLAQAFRQNREYAAAIYTFKAYKRLEDISPRQATAAELLITKCEAEQTKADAVAALREARSAPDMAAAAPGNPAATLAPGPARPSVAALDRSPPAANAQQRTAHFYEDLLGDGLFVGGLAAAGVGIGLLLQGNSGVKQSALEPTEAAAHAAAESAHGKQIAGSILFPTGGALIALAVWRWISLGSDGALATSAMSIGPGYVGYVGQF